ncbi:hypothetical protein HYPSUDRAFT_950691 [Hypholoma sublateritium FD-334 SS-4]|uniref:Uncharacterized protein n=1 Tax=Hypholoma sublateritium (strain FD-334 SS-4) TaxID=945553 RepID=A0A0D2NI10_HYPSF|nr:hypothetical protein HYPSUDRAFT_950691 [Hypholoma sublateritium FD-334 SS-4]
MDVTPIEPSGTVPVKPEEAPSITLPPHTLPDLPVPNEGETKPAADATQEMETTTTTAPTTAPEETRNEVKVEVKLDVKLEIKPEVVLEHSQPKLALEYQPGPSPSLPHISVNAPQRTGDNIDVKMDNVESPKPSAVFSNNSAGSSPKPSPVINDYGRNLPTGPRYGGRSPPRGPRYRPMPPSQLPTNSHQFTPRGPRRDYRSSTSSYSNPTMKSGVPLPQIPRYVKEKALQPQIDLETEVNCYLVTLISLH